MTTAQRELWSDFLTSLAISYTFALGALPFLPLPMAGRFLAWLASGMIFGVGFFLLGTVRSRIRAPIFILNLLLTTGLTSGTLLLCFLAMLWAIAAVQQPSHIFEANFYRGLIQFLVDSRQGCLLFGGIGLLVSAGINVAFQFAKKLGPGVLWHWITGRYYTPREEEMIFMFLDMRDSTGHAERLGTLRFSALVRDVFRDLTYPVMETRAQISHFIGDEAVIFWRPKDGVKNANCIQIFFRFQNALAERGSYYRTTYGFIPEFKAGVHIGPVVATEVGEIKSEIVFHGDTLNTAARIQGMCNELGSLLISEELADQIVIPFDRSLCRLGPIPLKGKTEELSVCSIELKNVAEGTRNTELPSA
jgi:adenylate cyclase